MPAAMARPIRDMHSGTVSPESAPSPHDDAGVRAALLELGCADRDSLAIGGVPMRELLRRFGSPLYAFDGAALRRRARAVGAAFGPQFALLWSVKANPSVALARILREAGCGAEIASLGELEVALAAGFPASLLRFAGPGKTRADLAVALQRGVGVFHVECESEVDDLAELAGRFAMRAACAVRVNLTGRQHGGRLRMAGAGARFGVDQDRALSLLSRIRDDGRLTLRGLHSYSGTQVFDAAAFVESSRALCELADEWESALGSALEEIDLGGGFGVATYLGDPAFDLEAAAHGVRKLVEDPSRSHRRHFVELGRYLAAPCGVYAASVVRKKPGCGRVHLALDGGMHHCAVAAGLGSVLKRPPLLVHADRLRAQDREVVAVGGPLCTPQDQFAEAVALPRCEPGDAIAVLAAGAYGLTSSPFGFLSHAAPAEALVEDGEARVVRSRGAATDALRGQSP